MFAVGYDHETDSPTNALSPFIPALVLKLFETAEKGNGLKEDAYEAASDLLSASADDVQNFVVTVLQESLNRLFIPQTAGSPVDHVSLICGIINVCVRKLPKEILIAGADPIMSAMLQVLSSGADKTIPAHEEAFMTIGLLAEKLELDFEKYIAAFFPFMLAGLKRETDLVCCITALGAAGDVFRALKLKMLPSCDEIVSTLISLLRSGIADRFEIY
jgi:importin subunit beta-1